MADVGLPVDERYAPPARVKEGALDAGVPAMITRVLFLTPNASPAAAFQEVYQRGVDDSIWYNDTQLPSPGRLNGVLFAK